MVDNAARVEWLTVAGDPEVWRSIGLTVSADGLVPLFGTSLRIVAPAVSGSAVSGSAVSGSAVSGSAVSGSAVSGSAVSGSAVSGVAVSGAAVSGSAVSGVAVSEAAASGSVAPAGGSTGPLDTVATDASSQDLGLVGWAFSGIPDVGDVAGFPTEVVDVEPPRFAAHALGASQLDHVVIFTGNMDEVSAAIEARTGCERRRIRDLGKMQQGFHRIGRGGLIVEIVQHADRDRSTEMWGLVLIVEDLDAACELLGEDRVSAPKDAVQPGRRIATIRTDVGLGTAVALMSA